MDLNNIENILSIDHALVIDQIKKIPELFLNSWNRAKGVSIGGVGEISLVVLVGLGWAKTSAELLTGYASTICDVPILVHSDYALPTCVNKSTLVILLSDSGDSEVLLSSLRVALERGCLIFSINARGELLRFCENSGISNLNLDLGGSRVSTPLVSMGVLLHIFEFVRLIPAQGACIKDAVEVMKNQQTNLGLEIPTSSNPAKRLAGQLVGRDIIFLASGCLAPVAFHWKTQFNLLAKTWSQYERLPEADFNTLASLTNPQEALTRKMAIFMRAECDDPKNRLRSDLTREVFMLEAVGTDYIEARGSSRLSNMCSLLNLGDYVAYYLAIAYQVDPAPPKIIDEFSHALHQ